MLLVFNLGLININFVIKKSKRFWLDFDVRRRYEKNGMNFFELRNTAVRNNWVISFSFVNEKDTRDYEFEVQIEHSLLILPINSQGLVLVLLEYVRPITDKLPL